jgi:ribonuclease HII
LADRGIDLDKIKIPYQSVTHGDIKVFSIACASILAKVTRDRLMIKLDKKYPQYGFARHKGYGTKFHQKAIKKYGPCPIHRRSFALTKSL